ncbi:Smr domain protein [Ascosphaera apis ARSEF 7405]|uniref:Smr domain protein n=1 Tax=Ascosphaera apis ARSEF 7405 TaxID=392613 RepID=A0A162ID94_9EURO|nr:Smr domain protein [Ascosphaera apis ARSEF 7405]
MDEHTVITTSAEATFNSLEHEFCPPLDAALFAAIALDYNLANSSEVQSLRETLEALRAEAAADQLENISFDPSGTGGNSTIEIQDDGLAIHGNDGGERRETISSLEDDMRGLERDIAGIDISSPAAPSTTTTAFPRFEISEATGGAFRADYPEEDKLRYLREMFPAIDTFTIRHTLGKCEGDVDKCMDNLLNLMFFEDRSQSGTGTATGTGTGSVGSWSADGDGPVSVPKGVEGFSEEVAGAFEAKKKGKGKKKNRNNGRRNGNGNGNRKAMQQYPPENYDNIDYKENASIHNKWTAATKDVDFVVSRTNLSAATVTSAYHSNNANLPATIHILAENEVARVGRNKLLADEVTQTQIAEMKTIFGDTMTTATSVERGIPIDIKFAGLLSISRNVISAAIELAHVMLETPTPSSSSAGLPPLPESLPVNATYTTSLSTATSHFTTSQSAFEAASSAYRRSKSDHYYSAVAAHYAQLGRDHLALAKSSSATAADALVASQSGPDFLDLHGVNVQHAVRISRIAVRKWWDQKGDEKFKPRAKWARDVRADRGEREGREGALARDGWKVEVVGGGVVVWGVARR